MKFGIFLLMQSPDMLPSSEIYRNALEQAQMADQLGFDYVVAAEHHFSSYGFLPNPLMLIATLAQHTKQVRFSTAVVVLPLRNPIQTAEEIAMLDHLTNGRLEVGFGTGYQQYEFQRFQVPSGKVFDMDIIADACAIRGVIISAKNPEFVTFPHRYLCHIG